MQRNTRLIEHLTLNEVPRAAIRHTVFLIEDALRTASMSGSDRSFYLIRKLDLGDIYPNQTAVELSRRFELSWAQYRSQAVDGRSEHAAAANIVAFPSFAVLLAHYCKRRFRSERCDAWFFTKHIPMQIQSASQSELLTVTLFFLYSRPEEAEGRSILPEFIAVLREESVMDQAIACSSPSAIQALLSMWLPRFLTAATAAPSEEVAPRGQEHETPMHKLITLALRTIALQPRIYMRNALDSYLETLALTGALASTLSSPRRPAPRLEGRSLHQPDTLESTAIPEMLDAKPLDRFEEDVLPAEASMSHRLDDFEGQPEQLTDRSAMIPFAYEPPMLSPTHLGGLYFAIHILDRLNFFTDVPEEEQPPLLDSILHLSVAASGIDHFDPLWISAGELHPAAASWFQQLRHWPRQHARMLLNWIIRRPALCRITRSHIDVHFGHNQADIRLRKLGLDLNPGWIFCLGKVITFHYDENPA